MPPSARQIRPYGPQMPDRRSSGTNQAQLCTNQRGECDECRHPSFRPAS